MSEEYTRDDLVTATNTSSQIFGIRPRGDKREVIFIRNNGTAGETISLAFGNKTAVSGAGVTLSNGQAHVESSGPDFHVWQQQIQIISSAATCAVSIMER